MANSDVVEFFSLHDFFPFRNPDTKVYVNALLCGLLSIRQIPRLRRLWSTRGNSSGRRRAYRDIFKLSLNVLSIQIKVELLDLFSLSISSTYRTYMPTVPIVWMGIGTRIYSSIAELPE